MNTSNDENENLEEPELFDQILDSGNEVAYQDWDSSAPGSGAGRVSVYEFEHNYYVLHDAGMDGPFTSASDAITSGRIDVINSATVAIWHRDKKYVYRRK